MKLSLNIDFNFILINKLFLSFFGSFIAIIILFIYKCIFIDKNINKFSFIKLFILVFIINYIILYIYSININHTNINSNTEQLVTGTPPDVFV